MSSQGTANGEAPRQHERRDSIENRAPRVLLAEDDKAMRAMLVEALARKGYEVTECGDGVDLLSRLCDVEGGPQKESFDLLISDIRMPGLTAFEILEGLRSRNWVPPVILITAFGDEETHELARDLKVAAIFDKPFELPELIRTAEGVLNR